MALGLMTHSWPLQQEMIHYDMERWRKIEYLVPHVLHLSGQYEMSQTLQESNTLDNDLGRLLSEAGELVRLSSYVRIS